MVVEEAVWVSVWGLSDYLSVFCGFVQNSINSRIVR